MRFNPARPRSKGLRQLVAALDVIHGSCVNKLTRSCSVSTRHFRVCRFTQATVLGLLVAGASCVPSVDVPALPIETGFSIVNFSKRFYLAIALREHDSGSEYYVSPLLPPGGTSRIGFFEAIQSRCPGALDIRVYLYRRVNDDIPIGLDEGEQVESVPVVAGEIVNIPACNVETLETYTIVNWDAPEGTARVKFAQCSGVDAAIRSSGIFANADAVWEVQGVDADLLGGGLPRSDPPLPPLVKGGIGAGAALVHGGILGRVVTADGEGVAGVVVLVRSRFRTRLDCAADNAADSGYGDPIAFAVTDEAGRFSIDRPAGVYRLEFYSDVVAFRPGVMDVETPLDEITILAEAL